MRKILILFPIIFVLFFASGGAQDVSQKISSDQKLEQIQKMIQENGYHWIAGKTSLSDLPEEELQKRLGLKVPSEYEERLKKGKVFKVEKEMVFPTVFDWRDSGGVTPVKNQGNCGSCWAFAAMGAFESMIKIYDSVQYDLSEQQILSCNFAESGCMGGWMDDAYQVFQSYGSVLESCMPYQASDGVPCIQTSCEVMNKIQGWTAVNNDVNSIKAAVQTGPVACAMTVYDDFFSYIGGCYENTGTDPINHGVLIVGWNDTLCSGNGAWIVKNSWGTGWGMNGFFYIKYNSCNVGYGADLLNYTPSNPTQLAYQSSQISDSSGDNDGIIDPGETINLKITLKNIWKSGATGVSATLRTTNSKISMEDSVATYPDIPKGQNKTCNYPYYTMAVDPTATLGTKVNFTLNISCAEGTYTDSFHLFVGELKAIFFDNMEGTDNGWTHGYSRGLDDWQHGVPLGGSWTDPKNAYSGTKIWGNNLNANYTSWTNNYLESPPINCQSYQKVRLQYYCFLGVEKGIYDHAKILINGSLVWQNDPNYDQIDHEWRNQDIDISSYADNNSSVKIRFQLISDSYVNLGGWNIDDFSLVGIGTSNHIPPNPFSLISPVDQDTVFLLSPTLFWHKALDSDSGDVVTYKLFYSLDSTFATAESIYCSQDTSVTLLALSDDKRYFWKVKATDSHNLFSWSSQTNDLLTFLIQAPNSFSLVYPPNETIIYVDTLTLSWQSATDPDPNDSVLCTLYYSRSSVFNSDSTIIKDSIPQSHYNVSSLFVDSLQTHYFWKVKAFDIWGQERWSNQSRSFATQSFIRGDVNHDQTINLEDVIFLANYLVKIGTFPVSLSSGDTECNGKLTLSDVVFLANYVLKGGTPPGCPYSLGGCH
jgi:C1A family cysteine protease